MTPRHWALRTRCPAFSMRLPPAAGCLQRMGLTALCLRLLQGDASLERALGTNGTRKRLDDELVRAWRRLREPTGPNCERRRPRDLTHAHALIAG